MSDLNVAKNFTIFFSALLFLKGSSAFDQSQSDPCCPLAVTTAVD